MPYLAAAPSASQEEPLGANRDAVPFVVRVQAAYGATGSSNLNSSTSRRMGATLSSTQYSV